MFKEKKVDFLIARNPLLLLSMWSWLVHMEVKCSFISLSFMKCLRKVFSIFIERVLFSFTDRVKPPMIAFSAYNPIDKSLDTNQILILQTVRLNEGDGYDNVLGTFTAPVTGLYLFTAHVCNYSGRGVYYDIVLEYTTIARSTQFNSAQYDCSSVSAITMVTADQRVWVTCTSGNSNNQLYEDSHRQTSFAGVLLQI